MSAQQTRIEITGNLVVHHPVKDYGSAWWAPAENPQPCRTQCGQPMPCWGCE